MIMKVVKMNLSDFGSLLVNNKVLLTPYIKEEGLDHPNMY